MPPAQENPPVRENYCIDCNWSASTEEYDRQELSHLTIEHAVEHEHDIDSISVEPEDYESVSSFSVGRTDSGRSE